MKDCDPIEQQQRFERLEALYEADGRHDRSHPHHAVYTGLVVNQQQPETKQ